MNGIQARLAARLARAAQVGYTAEGATMLTFWGTVQDGRAGADAAVQRVYVSVFGEEAEQLAGRLARGDVVECAGRLVVRLDQAPPFLELVATDVRRVAGRRARQRQRPLPKLFRVTPGAR